MRLSLLSGVLSGELLTASFAKGLFFCPSAGVKNCAFSLPEKRSVFACETPFACLKVIVTLLMKKLRIVDENELKKIVHNAELDAPAIFRAP